MDVGARVDQPRHLGAVAHLHRVEELAAQLDLAPAVVGHVLDVVWKPAGVRPDRDVDVLAAQVVRLDERKGGEDSQHREIRFTQLTARKE